MAEGIKRLAGEIAIGAPRHGIIGEGAAGRPICRRSPAAGPAGLKSPAISPATACPPSPPGYQASTIAGMCASAQFTLSALPFISTSTTGLPVAWTRSSNFCCGAGRSRLVRSPPAKPGAVDLHLLAFDPRRKAADEQHQIGLFRRRHGVIAIAARHAPDELLAAALPALEGLDAERILAPLFQCDRARKDRRRIADAPFVDDELVADPDAIAILASEAEADIRRSRARRACRSSARMSRDRHAIRSGHWAACWFRSARLRDSRP